MALSVLALGVQLIRGAATGGEGRGQTFPGACYPQASRLAASPSIKLKMPSYGAEWQTSGQGCTGH